MLKVNEIFYSLQGESSQAGKPCVFIRFAGCNLRCRYCDTKYAYSNGILMSMDQVLRTLAKYDCPLVLITGGEPLMQEESFPLMDKLLELEYNVMLETNGSQPVQDVAEGVMLVMDPQGPHARAATDADA